MDAQALTKALGGHWAGSTGSARCPAHNDRTPSLSITEIGGRVLFKCHGGCPQDTVLKVFKSRGLWHEAKSWLPEKPMLDEPTEAEKAKMAECQKVWDCCALVENTPAQLYLQCRGIVSTETPLPPSLRYHEGQNALVAAITKPNDNEIVALQVIYLTETKTGISKTKKLTHGPARFGSVKLAEPDTKMQITESVEDGLALMQMNAVPTIAVPGTSFLASHVIPPRECQTVVLAPDNDAAGQKAISEATPRLHALGFNVRVLLPPPCRDWCDILPEFEERRACVEEEFYG